MQQITAEQLMAARSLLRWFQKDLANKVEIHPSIICAHERGKRMSPARTQKIVSVFESQGIQFLNSPEGAGVMLRNNGKPNKAEI